MIKFLENTYSLYIGTRSKLLTDDAVESLLASEIPVPLVRLHEVCPNNDYLYHEKDDISLTSCPNCETARAYYQQEAHH